MTSLGAEPAELAPLPRDFFRGLVVLLDTLAPPLLDATMTKATPREDGVEVVLAHATRIEFSLWAQASRATIVVGCSAMHEERDTAPAALALVEELLRGQRAVRGYDGATLRPTFLA